MEAAAVSKQGSQFDIVSDDESMNKLCDEIGGVSDATFNRLISEIIKESLDEIEGSPVEETYRKVKNSVDVIGIMPFFGKCDVIQELPSGPGRTNIICAFVFKQVDRTVVKCQALVLSPTYEQAQEVEDVMRLGGGDQSGIKVRAPSSSLVKEETNLACHVLVATPADVLDMISSGSITTDNISMFVLDDADQLLSRGFKDQILEVFRLLPPNLQVGMFSETTPHELLQLSDELMHPKEVQLPAKKPKT